jgi:hypothetical protein
MAVARAAQQAATCVRRRASRRTRGAEHVWRARPDHGGSSARVGAFTEPLVRWAPSRRTPAPRNQGSRSPPRRCLRSRDATVRRALVDGHTRRSEHRPRCRRSRKAVTRAFASLLRTSSRVFVIDRRAEDFAHVVGQLNIEHLGRCDAVSFERFPKLRDRCVFLPRPNADRHGRTPARPRVARFHRGCRTLALPPAAAPVRACGERRAPSR